MFRALGKHMREVMSKSPGHLHKVLVDLVVLSGHVRKTDSPTWKGMRGHFPINGEN